MFQYQLEYQKIQQERFELDNKFADISIVWDMGDIYTNGWFYTEKEARFEKMNYIVALLPERIYEDSLGLSREYVEWSVKSVSQLSREKAQIEGYVIDKDLADGIPLGFQKDYIDLYNYQIMQLNNITDLSLQWHNLTIDERAAGNIKNYELSTELVGIYDRMFAKHDQFVKIGVEEGERYNKQKEILDLTEENLKKTNVLAKIGLVSGGALFFGMVFYKLFWRSREHTNTSTNRSRRRR